MRSLSVQFRAVTPVLLISWLVTLLALLLTIYVSTQKDISLDTFTKDPVAFLDAPFYIGFFSNIGIMIWSGAVMICWFTAFRVRNSAQQKEDFLFMVFSGVISLMMTLDDLFQLHELVFPRYLAVSENMVYVTYLNIFLLYFLRFRNRILRSEYIVYVLAFFFLGLSTIIDILPLPIEKDTFLEDAIKLVGIVSWFIYFFRTGNEILDRRSVFQ